MRLRLSDTIKRNCVVVALAGMGLGLGLLFTLAAARAVDRFLDIADLPPIPAAEWTSTIQAKDAATGAAWAPEESTAAAELTAGEAAIMDRLDDIANRLTWLESAAIDNQRQVDILDYVRATHANVIEMRD